MPATASEKERDLIANSMLYIKNLSKTFGGTQALKSVELEIKPGEIHGLLGQNGCGKSTLIKVLAGYHHPDPGGELWIKGESIPLPLAPGEFARYGMSFVHQDLGLVTDLTVLENLCINKIAVSSAAYIDWKKEKARAVEIFNRYHIRLNPDAYVASLASVERAMLAIIRAVEDINSNESAVKNKRGLLVLDEPTVFLPRTEVDTLFSLVRKVAAEGISVLFVSHDIDEVKELTDRFTVLRDGQNVGTAVTAEFHTSKIIEMILGQELQRYEVEDKGISGDSGVPEVRVENLRGDILRDVTFSVKEGEVLGITGLVGSGFEEAPYVIFGHTPQRSGTICIKDKKYDIAALKPDKAVHDAKMALIPADRPNMGGIADLLIEENLLMQVMNKYNAKKLQLKRMERDSYEIVESYEVRPRDPNLNFSQLSGGNQQKVLMAKWMLAEPDLLILHEPTQGVDVGARQQLLRHVESAAQKGTAVLCCSSDYEQLEQICDRVLVLVRGKISTELTGAEITKARITQLCYDSGEAAAE